ncbi:hypothetical protein BLS_009517 [Venturia inaequalis]|uniref:RNA polymerase II holoenzyme cyclin-like subunit n=1 Tax=Venturia inaequalis TaxID=5025 RepID=A0A8H3V506_VENIN|nr:hypothetical protein EG328_009106 [Venturia inaequalis]KAE9979704.1 hypothetical protein BLS_009517 [Venturia inaequalis]KAE9980823.1 hypothetical protein EG327_006434 [Venturia inaequalis]RDI76802.1 hypothetical protein Vi05172_g13204 [Venturia inaequalis]
MAANYWNSTQRKYWTFTKKELAEIRKNLEAESGQIVSQYPLPDRRLLNIYFSHQLAKLAKRMAVRQQALATAQVYMRRFYIKREIRATNPYLVLSTAFYLACKMEECPQHIRVVVGEARQFWSDTVSSDTSKLGECEFHLISEMNSQLIVHHPYRTLTDMQTQFNLNTDEMSLAWSIVNDHYFTDLPLLHPPHVIAITAVFLATVLKPNAGTTQAQNMHNAMQQLNAKTGGTVGAQPRVQSLLNWLAESAISIEAIVDCTQELISLYQLWDGFNEKACKEQVSRFVKARGLDK